MTMFRQALRIMALLAGVLLIISAAQPTSAIATRPYRSPQAPAATSPVYLPLVRTPPPPPTKLISIADDDVIQGFPTENFANDSAMWLGYHKADCTNNTASRKIGRDLIQFDLAEIPRGAQIVSAKLNVQVVGECWFTRTAAPVTAYRISQSWTEATATWNTQPKFAEAYGSVAIPLNYNAAGWYAIDVTNLMRGWVSGSVPNYGVMLRAPEGGGNDFAFIELASRSDPGYEPYLQITYAGAAALEATATGGNRPGVFACRTTESGASFCAVIGASAEKQR